MPRTRTTLFDALTTSGSRASAPSGGGTSAVGPPRTPSGSTRSIVASRRSGGYTSLIPGEDRGLLHRAAEVVLAREVEEHRPDRPAENDPGGRAEHEARDRVDRAEARHRPDRRPQHRPEQARDPAQERAAEHGPGERDDGRVRRAVAQERGRDLRADVRAEREAGERERAADEPRREPVERGQATTPSTIQSALDTDPEATCRGLRSLPPGYTYAARGA